MPLTITAHGYRFAVLTAGQLPGARVTPALAVVRKALGDMDADKVSRIHADDAACANQNDRRPAELSVIEAKARRALASADRASQPQVLISAA